MKEETFNPAIMESYRELFRTLTRLNNTNNDLLLDGDLKRLNKAREILNRQSIEGVRIVKSVN